MQFPCLAQEPIARTKGTPTWAKVVIGFIITATLVVPLFFKDKIDWANDFFPATVNWSAGTASFVIVILVALYKWIPKICANCG
jgi:hypothetical protein